MASIIPSNNLPASSQPWGREIQKKLEQLEIMFNLQKVNSATVDSQLQSSYKRLDQTVRSIDNVSVDVAAITEISNQATQTANTALSGLNSLANEDSLYPVNASNLSGGTIDPSLLEGLEGPPNVLTIGTVTAGTPASATITGTSPSQVLNLVLQTGATGAAGPAGADGAPGEGVAAGGVAGQILTKVDSTDYNTTWEDVPESAGVIVSSTPPVDTNSIWFNNETGVTYIYYDDFWTSISGAAGSPIISDTAPINPTLGMQWFNSTNGKTYLYFSNAWIEIDSNGTTAQPSGNAIINGAFDIWQRGTSQVGGGILADRWDSVVLGSSITQSRQSFISGQEPPSGNKGDFFHRTVVTSAGNSGSIVVNVQKIENVKTFAGEAVTISFWAKADSNKFISTELAQVFGGGGSASSIEIGVVKHLITTSWNRYFVTTQLPSISGKTIGSGSFLQLAFWLDAGSNFNSRTNSIGNQSGTFDIWGVQVESGSVATPFKRNSPNIQSELAACQRYYQRWQADTNFSYLGGFINPSAGGDGPGFLTLFTPLRATPTSVSFGNIALSSLSDTRFSITNVTINAHATASNGMLQFFASGGGLSPGTLYKLQANNNPNGFIALSAEL